MDDNTKEVESNFRMADLLLAVILAFWSIVLLVTGTVAILAIIW